MATPTIASKQPLSTETRISQQASPGRNLFRIILVYFLFEFGRIQSVVPGLSAIPLPTMMLALLGFSAFASGKLRFSDKQTKWWLLLFLLMAVHVPLANNNFWALMIAKDMLLLFIFYLAVVTFVDTLDKIQTMITVWLGVHAFLAVSGVLHNGQGVGGWLGDENDMCMALNVAIPFAYFALFSPLTKFKKALYVSLLCLLILATMTTLSRGGFIGLTAVGTYCWLKSSKKFTAIILVGFVMCFMLLFAPEQYWEEIRSSTSDETLEVGTGAERLYTWGIGWEMFLGNPILGVGQGNFPWTFEQYQEGKTFLTKSLAGRQAHSLYFTLLPELGLVGACIFAALLFYSYKDLRVVRKIYENAQHRLDRGQIKEDYKLKSAFYLACALEASMIGYLVSSVFISTLYYPPFWVLIGFVVALKNATVREYGKEYSESPRNALYGLSSRVGLSQKTAAPFHRMTPFCCPTERLSLPLAPG